MNIKSSILLALPFLSFNALAEDEVYVGDDYALTKINLPAAIDVLANDQGTWVSASLTQPQHGTITVVDLKLRYQPNNDFTGQDSFTYTIKDQGGTELTANVTIDVIDFTEATTPQFSCDETSSICNKIQSTTMGENLGYGRGAAIVDVNSDGLNDIFISDSDDRHQAESYGVSKFFLNNGDGTFTETDLGVAESDVFANWSGSFADYDNDGDPDLLLVNGGYTGISELAFYINKINETGKFEQATVSSGIAVVNKPEEPSSWWGASWTDYDNDGFLDLAVSRIKGPVAVFHNEQGQSFKEVSQELGITLSYGDFDDGKNPVWYDYDGDGDFDLYFAGFLKHALYQNNSGTAFVDVTDQVFTQPFPSNVNTPSGSPAVFAAAAADFNQDGKDDLYLGRWTEQDVLLMNNANNSYVLLGSQIGLDMINTDRTDYTAVYENTMGLGVGDFFNDGFPDVFLGSGDPERADKDIFYCNEGTGFFRCTDQLNEGANEPYRTRGHAPVFGDLNHDGYTDLFINNGGHPEWDAEEGKDTREGYAFYVRQEAAVSNHVVLTLEGTTSNRDAIGARVRLNLSNRSYFYAVRSSQGFQAQNGKEIIMNLQGESSGSVIITWPNGQTSQHTVNAGQKIKILQPNNEVAKLSM